MNSLKIALLILLSISAAFSEDEFAQVRAKGDYSVPFRSGIWFVGQGGDTLNVNAHMGVPEQEYGIDIVRTESRSLTKGEGKLTTDYFSFGETVISPCEGIVVDCHSESKDNGIGESDTKNVYGNYVLIKVLENEYVVLAHFKQKSLRIKTGDVLKSGDILGLVGNSGNTTFPHIHMHIQDAPQLGTGHGLLFAFSRAHVVVSGTELKGDTIPLLRGMWLSSK